MASLRCLQSLRALRRATKSPRAPRKWHSSWWGAAVDPPLRSCAHVRGSCCGGGVWAASRRSSQRTRQRTGRRCQVGGVTPQACGVRVGSAHACVRCVCCVAVQVCLGWCTPTPSNSASGAFFSGRTRAAAAVLCATRAVAAAARSVWPSGRSSVCCGSTRLAKYISRWTGAFCLSLHTQPQPSQYLRLRLCPCACRHHRRRVCSVAEYFGTSIAFYFLFVEFYTLSLFAPAIAGVAVVLLTAAGPRHDDRSTRHEIRCTS